MSMIRKFAVKWWLITVCAFGVACADSGSAPGSGSGADEFGHDSYGGQSTEVVSPWEGSECDGGRTCDGSLILECRDGVWVTVSECGDGLWCDNETSSCAEAVCDRGERRCVDQHTFEVCASDRTEWLEPQRCPGEQVCHNGACLRPECYPGVLFMVDRSQSMLPQWDQVSDSISRLMASNPSVRYGMLAFPNDVVDENMCRTGQGWPEVSIGDEQGGVISDWLTDNLPDGATPLAATLQWVSREAETLWNGEEVGYLVILSDGGDSCSCKHVPDGQLNACLNERYGQATSQLLQKNIRTYVVGYSYDDDSGGLDIIARQGGTGRDGYTYVGDESELNQAFESIIREIKECY